MNATGHRRLERLAAWIGAALSVAALLSYFTVFVRFPDLRDTPWLNLLLMAAGLGISVWAVLRRRTRWSVAGAVLSVLCMLALTGYVYGLSNQLPGSGDVVAVGERAPMFELHDTTGRVVGLDDLSSSTIVLVFYRGHW